MSSLGLFENDVELFEPDQPVPAPVAWGPAPPTPLMRYIPVSGSPNRLLETYDPREALELVTEQHAALADWIRAQEWRSNPPSECGRYIHATRRMKSCRNQLRKIVKQIERDDREAQENGQGQ